MLFRQQQVVFHQRTRRRMNLAAARRMKDTILADLRALQGAVNSLDTNSSEHDVAVLTADIAASIGSGAEVYELTHDHVGVRMPSGEVLLVSVQRGFLTGCGEPVGSTHVRNARCAEGCVIHNSTDKRQQLPTHWRGDNGLMERICPCGIGHPDRDAIRYIESTRGKSEADAWATHGCCGKPSHCSWC